MVGVVLYFMRYGDEILTARDRRSIERAVVIPDDCLNEVAPVSVPAVFHFRSGCDLPQVCQVVWSVPSLLIPRPRLRSRNRNSIPSTGRFAHPSGS
jgi:hypothetical protein